MGRRPCGFSPSLPPPPASLKVQGERGVSKREEMHQTDVAPGSSTEWGVYGTVTASWAAEHVVLLELNRPGNFNAMNGKWWREMREILPRIGADSRCRVVVLAGRGKHFTAGLDLAAEVCGRGPAWFRRGPAFSTGA